MNKKLLFLILVILLIASGIFYLEQTKKKIPIEKTESEQTTQTTELKEGKYQRAPELKGISGYLNTDEITIEELTNQGKIILVDFWTYSCINCIRTLPFLTAWDEKYKDMGLVIIGVHTPEFTFEEKYENVQNAINKYNIKYPVVQDNNYATWRAFKNNYWPRKYLIDNEGYIRYDHIGEGKYEETEEKIKELLAEIGTNTENIELTKQQPKKTRFFLTPELYAGHEFALSRGQDIGNKEGLQPGKTISYNLPNQKENNQIYLDGDWTSNPDNLNLESNTGEIYLKFVGGQVNIVAESKQSNQEDIKVEVLINNKPVSKHQAGTDVTHQENTNKAFLTINIPQLYNIIDGDYVNDELTLKIKSSDFAFNAFTFG